MVRSADLVLAMENQHLYEINNHLFFRCKYASLLGSFDPKRQNPEIEDPYGSPMNAYQACASEISHCIPGLIDHIRSRLTVKAFLPVGTLRQQIIDLLGKAAMTALDISQTVHISEKDVYRHLTHIQKSVASQGRKLSFTPSTCLACGFTFTDRRRLTKPGRCPRCRESRIDHPIFKIEALNAFKVSKTRGIKENS
jgi:predicted Zn-ribbon and HTH transcriptional regulator